MSTDIDFVKFVKQRKHAKPDMEDLYEIDFLGRKKAGVSFNDTVRNEVKKAKLKEGDTSLSDFLSKNKNKIVEEPKKEINIKEEKEESDNDSEDLSEEKINHYIGGEKNNIDEMEEIINEIKDRTQIIKSKRNKKDKKNKKEKRNKKDKKDKKNNNKDELNLDENEDEDDADNDRDINKNNE